jgi:Arc/MetJ-type ribon-helix-helix transcriptional regulator
MPSSLHEVLLELFRHRPVLAAELLADALEVPLPDYDDARLDAAELTDIAPTEYRADVVVALSREARTVLSVVVEAQMRRDPDKRWSWPTYLTTLRARLRCPTVLLVVCVDAATAAWCGQPIDLGHPGWQLTPLTLGPDQVPLVTDTEQARRAPELAVLSAMAHGADPDGERVLDALLGALAAVGSERATLYSDIVLAALPLAARRYLEALVTAGTYEYRSDLVRRYVDEGRTQGRAEGQAKGEAKAVLTFLDARGIDIPDAARNRITACTDIDQLDVWVRRAATAESIDDLFR